MTEGEGASTQQLGGDTMRTRGQGVEQGAVPGGGAGASGGPARGAGRRRGRGGGRRGRATMLQEYLQLVQVRCFKQRGSIFETRLLVLGVSDIAQMEEGELDTGAEYKVPVPAPEPMINIGPMSVKGSILDDVLSEKKCQLLESPEILEFLKLHGVKQ